LTKKYKNLNFHEISFPSKKFFGSLDIETVERRKVLLNDFLSVLCQRYKDFNLVEFMEFLDIRKMYLKASTNPNSLAFTDKPIRTTQETEQILKYVSNLNKNPENLSSTFIEFEKFYFNTKPKMNLDVVKNVLTGDNKMRGILHFCGKFDEIQDSHLVCSVGLSFLNKLLSYETNTEAEMFNNVYTKVHPKLLKKMRLQNHIVGKSQRNCKAHALRLLHIYMSRHPNESLMEIIEDEEAVQEYEKWKVSQTTTSIRAENYIVDPNQGQQKEELKYKDDGKADKNDDYINLELNQGEFLDMFKEDQIKWTLFDTNEDWFRFEYSSNVFVKMRIFLEIDLKDCVDYFTECCTWMKNIIDYRPLNTKEDTIAILTKYNFDEPPYKSMILIQERKIEEDYENDLVRILEKPYQTQGVMMSKDEAVGRRLMSITIKTVTVPPDNEKRSKIKILIKNLNPIAKQYMSKELNDPNPSTIESIKALKKLITTPKEK